ncbi:MAG: DUF3592 domain-containing protein [archaeon]
MVSILLTARSPVVFILLMAGFIATGLGLIAVLADFTHSNWPTIEGTVTSSEIVSTPSESGKSYNGLLHYAYQLDGSLFTGKGWPSGGGIEFVEHSKVLARLNEGLAKFPAGSKIIVHYNPSNPAESSLTTGFVGLGLAVLVFGIFLLICGIILAFFIANPYLSKKETVLMGFSGDPGIISSSFPTPPGYPNAPTRFVDSAGSKFPNMRAHPGKWSIILVVLSILIYFWMEFPIFNLGYQVKWIAAAGAIVLFWIVYTHLQQRKMKKVKRDPIPTYIALVGVAVGVYFWINHFPIEYYLILFMLTILCVFFFAILVPLLLTGSKIKKFVQNHGLTLIKNADLSGVPRIFFNDSGPIPFDDIKNLIKVSNDFYIFSNRYALLDPYAMSFNSKNGANVGEIVPQNAFCFLFRIRPLQGYHKLILNAVLTKIYQEYYATIQGEKIARIQTGVKEIDDNYSVYSSQPDELRELITKIYLVLYQFPGVFTETNIYRIDLLVAMMEIHLTQEYVMLRTDYLGARHIEELYLLCRQIQKALA